MNRRFVRLLGLGLLLGLSAAATAAPAPGIAPEVKKSESVGQVQVAAIRAFQEAQLARLQSENLSDRQEAREALVRECDTSGTPAYVDGYVQGLVTLLPKAMQSDDHAAKLNAAVVIGRVTERTKNLRLKGAAIDLLSDKSDGVVIWGASSVRMLMLPQLRMEVAKNDPLLTRVVPAVSERLAGFVVQELYDAYRLSIVSERRTLTPEMLRAVAAPMLELLGKRVALYQQGTPDEPQSETVATSFLSDGSVWAILTPEQKSATLQACSNLVSGIGKRIVELDLKEAAGRARREELMQTAKLVGSAVGVIAQHAGNQNLQNAASAMGQLNPTFDPQTVAKLCAVFAEDIARAARTIK